MYYFQKWIRLEYIKIYLNILQYRIFKMCAFCFRYYSPGYSEVLLERLENYQPS